MIPLANSFVRDGLPLAGRDALDELIRRLAAVHADTDDDRQHLIEFLGDDLIEAGLFVDVAEAIARASFDRNPTRRNIGRLIAVLELRDPNEPEIVGLRSRRDSIPIPESEAMLDQIAQRANAEGWTKLSAAERRDLMRAYHDAWTRERRAK